MWQFRYLQSDGEGFSIETMLDELPWLRALETIEQEPAYHGEGNVLNHVKMVLGELVGSASWKDLTGEDKEVLFASALMHDVGKLFCTTRTDGVITAKKHAVKGAVYARQLMWAEIEPPFPFHIREDVVMMILLHSLPLWLHEKDDPERRVIQASQSLSIKRLSLLAEADVKGRICRDRDELLTRIDLFRDEAKRLGCYEKPYPFPSGAARYHYFSKENAYPGYVPYEDFRSTVTLMSGLPGAGKDYWIARNIEGVSVVSLDEIREELKISPGEKQHEVVLTAKERAKAFLRKGEDFVWNATCTTRLMRKQLVDLFVAYGAKVVMVYIEPGYDQLIDRNRNRKDAVPDHVMEKLIEKLEVPAVYEAHEVRYIAG